MGRPCHLPIGVLLCGAALLAGCGGGDEAKTPPPVPVEVVTAQPRPVPNIIDLPGRISAVRSAEVRARSDGIVLRRLYEEGADVKAGAPLFQIDPRDYRAQVQSAQATLEQAQSGQTNAAAVVARYKKLIADKAVSAQEFDKAEADLGSANAQVLQAKAALARAQLLLGYTTVRAPISGRVGRAEVSEGALVTGAQGTLMTRVDQASPVYAVFNESSAEMLDMLQQYRSGRIKVASLADVKITLVLDNGQAYDITGRLNFTSPVIDPETGTRTIRAIFANPDLLLTPGQFVRGRIEVGMVAGGFMIPSRAVQFKAEEASVSILGRDGSITPRPITLGAMAGNGWIVQSGLKPGDQVIVDGWQKARPGARAQVVKRDGRPVLAAPPATQPAAQPTAAPQQGG